MGFPTMFTFQLDKTKRKTLLAPYCRNGSCRYIRARLLLLFLNNNINIRTVRQDLNISTTLITAMGCWQCLNLSDVQLKGKHCRKPHCCNGVVDTVGPWLFFLLWQRGSPNYVISKKMDFFFKSQNL